MKRRIILLCIASLWMGWTNGQNSGVAINPDNADPHPSAILDINAPNQGLLIPRMGTAERLAIITPALSLMVFDTDEKAFRYFDGTAWSALGSGQGAFLPLTGGLMTGSIQFDDPVKNILGGVNHQALVQFNQYGKNDITLSSDNGDYAKGALYIGDDLVQLYGGTGITADVWANNKQILISAPPGPASTNSSGAAFTIIRGQDVNQSVLFADPFHLGLIDHSNLSFMPSNGLLIGNNQQAMIASTTIPGPGTLVSSQNSQVQAGVFNTVVLGGRNITAKTSHTAYVEQLAISPSGGQPVEGLLRADGISTDRSWTLPDKDGNLALAEDNPWQQQGIAVFIKEGKVGIGTETPDAALDVQSTTSGILPPRMTTVQRDAMDHPQPGHIIFNITINKHQGFDGSAWHDLY